MDHHPFADRAPVLCQRKSEGFRIGLRLTTELLPIEGIPDSKPDTSLVVGLLVPRWRGESLGTATVFRGTAAGAKIPIPS